MTATEARQVFDSAIATETDADRIAKLELLRDVQGAKDAAEILRELGEAE